MKLSDLLGRTKAAEDIVREVVIPLVNEDDTKPEMGRNEVLQWSMTIIKKVDESIAMLAAQYAVEPEAILSIYASIGMYCMGIAETIHNQLGHTHEEASDGKETTGLETPYHYDPNRGYL